MPSPQFFCLPLLSQSAPCDPTAWRQRHSRYRSLMLRTPQPREIRRGVVNTGTTVLTFLMVFVIQNTINRDAAAGHLKLDELLRARHRPPRRTMPLIGAEELGA